MMPVTTKVKCANCGRLVEATEVTHVTMGIAYCVTCKPLPVAEPKPETDPETEREPVTEDVRATDRERRAVIQDAPVLVPSEPSDGTLVKVPPAYDPEDPERTCGPVEIQEVDGDRMFNEVLPAPVEDQLIERLRDARTRLVVIKETIEMILPTGPEIRILSKMVNQAILKL